MFGGGGGGVRRLKRAVAIFERTGGGGGGGGAKVGSAIIERTNCVDSIINKKRLFEVVNDYVPLTSEI